MTGVVCFSKTTGVGTSSALPVTEYLRIHIRANSNAEDDQAVKYKVRDVIVQTLTPALKDCTTKSEAREKLCQNLTLVTSIADGVLKENGYAYGAKATYSKKNGLVVLYSGDGITAEVRDESKVQDQIVRGKRIRFWIGTEQVEVDEADLTGAAPSGGTESLKKALGK